MTLFRADWVTEALNCPPRALSATPPTEFHGIVTDSRKIAPGCLFVALKGEKFDGHDFANQALENGAAGVLVQKGTPITSKQNVLVYEVPETLLAYRTLGKTWRRKFKIPVALVAGSNGKTTTKEILFALLQGKFKTALKTQGSQNGFVGIPMTLLELNETHQAAVIEVGIDEPGAMKSHVDIVSPTVSVVTIIEPEHLEKLIDIDTVAREELYALSETSKLGSATAFNLDDVRIAPAFAQSSGDRKLGYGLDAKHFDEQHLSGVISSDLSSLEVRGGRFSKPEIFKLPLPGRHNATNLLAAVAVAMLSGLTADEMREGLKKFQAPEGRSEVKRLSDGTVVLCDYYNSQPASLLAGLRLLREAPGASAQAPRFACLADMLELGQLEEGFHREPAKALMDLKVDHVLLYGTRMKWLKDELEKQGYRGFLKHYASQAEMGQELIGLAKSGSVILIKGSNSMKMGEVWKTFHASRK